MVLIDKLWDDVIAGPQPEYGLGKLRKIATQPLSAGADGSGEGSSSKQFVRSLSMPSNSGHGTPPTPGTPTSASPTTQKHNVWRSVFHPGSNIATKGLGGELFDKPQPNSPTVYDWLYSGDTKSKHR